MKAIDWTFVAGTSLLIVNLAAFAADFLQGGIAWPLLAVAVGWQGVMVGCRVVRGRGKR